MPEEFWQRPELRAAFKQPKQRRFGAVVRAYRQARGPDVTQAQIADWLKLSASQLSRIETGKSAANDLPKLNRWAQRLRIPQRYLWFTLSALASEATTEQAAEPSLPATSGPADPGDSEDSGESEEGNVRRRQFLVAGPGAGLAVVTDRSRAGPTAGPAADGPVTAGRAVGMTDVVTVREMTKTFRDLDNKFGGGHSRSQANAYLTAIVDPMVRHGRYTDTVKTELFSATADLHELIGRMAYDTGQPLIGRRHFRDGLRLCQEVEDDALAARIWVGMSYEAHFAGAAEDAVDLALAAQRIAKLTPIGPLRSMAAIMEAQGLALQGEKIDCLAALRKAEQQFNKQSHDVPPWLSYYVDDAYLASKFALAFRDLRLPEEAERFARMSLEMPDGYEVGRLIRIAVLASALADQRRVDETCATATLAVDMAGDIRSIRTVVYLGDVARRLAPFRSAAEVRAVYGRMTEAGIPVPVA